MSRNLYFIKMLDQALSAPDPRTSLETAIKEINSLGRRPEYQKGYEQFVRFLSLVRMEIKGDEHTGSLSNGRSDSDLLLAPIQPFFDESNEVQGLPGIVVERNGETVIVMVVEGTGRIGFVEGVVPGVYVIRLENGRRLWHGEIARSDLIWREAFPLEPLPLAAETSKPDAKVSREITLLGGEVVVRVMPGKSSGRLDFFFNG